MLITDFTVYCMDNLYSPFRFGSLDARYDLRTSGNYKAVSNGIPCKAIGDGMVDRGSLCSVSLRMTPGHQFQWLVRCG